MRYFITGKIGLGGSGSRNIPPIDLMTELSPVHSRSQSIFRGLHC